MAVIPVSAREVSVHIHADRRLAFQVLTAFGAGGQNQASSRVLRRDEDRLLVEFHTPGISLTGRRRIYRTVEWVTTRARRHIFRGSGRTAFHASRPIRPRRRGRLYPPDLPERVWTLGLGPWLARVPVGGASYAPPDYGRAHGRVEGNYRRAGQT